MANSNKPGRKSYAKTERRRSEAARRQEAARRAAEADARRRRRRRFTRVGVAMLALLAVAGGTLALVSATTGGSDTPAAVTLNSPIVSDPTSAFAITDPPTAYAVTYRIDAVNSETGATTTSTETFEVQRPFNARITGLAGAPPGTDQQWQAITNLGLYSDTTGTDAPQVNQVAPHSALADFRLDATLNDLLGTGSFVAKERRTVLGRECQVYRTGKALESFDVAAANGTDYADACIDDKGLMLEEVTVASGALVQRVTATSVNDAVGATDADFKITGTPLTVAQGGSVLTPLDATKAPTVGYWVLDTPPEGYTLKARYKYSVPAPDAASTDPTASTTTTTTTPGTPPKTNDSFIDVYTNGINTILIQQGVVASQPQSDATDVTTTATVGNLGSSKIAVGLTGSTVVALPTGTPGWFVQATGTVPLATLQAAVGPLHATT